MLSPEHLVLACEVPAGVWCRMHAGNAGPGSRGHTDAAISGRSSSGRATRSRARPRVHSSSSPVAVFSSGWLWPLRCLGRRRITSGYGTYLGVVLWSEVQLSASVPGTTRTRGSARYRRDMDQLRPPLPQRLRPAHWVGIDCAVTALMALAYALIFRETADLRGIPDWASPAA